MKSNKKNTFYYLKKTYKYAKEEKKCLFYFLFFCIIMCIIDVILPLIAAKEIIALTSKIWDQLFLMILATLGVELIGNIVRFVSSN